MKEKTLTEEQIKQVKNYKIFNEENITWFLEQHKMSFAALKRRSTASGLKILYGYSYKEYLENKRLQNEYNKSYIQIFCEKCNAEYVTIIFGFFKRRHKNPVCNVCYRKYYLYDETWRENNSKAQKISQNKPEVLKRQSEIQKERHKKPGLKEKYIEIGKKLWENPEYRKKVIGKSGLSKRGVYNNIHYQSLVELSYILWCEKNNVNIINYDKEGISYNWEGKQKRYYPDFIVDSNTIVEIKGSGSIYRRFLEKNQEKFKVLEKWCSENNYKHKIIFDKELGITLRKEAKKIHGKINK